MPEMVEAALSGDLRAVGAANLPQQPRRRGPYGEALEVGKPALQLVEAEEITSEAMREDQGGMSAAAIFPHAGEDITRRVHGVRS